MSMVAFNWFHICSSGFHFWATKQHESNTPHHQLIDLVFLPCEAQHQSHSVVAKPQTCLERRWRIRHRLSSVRTLTLHRTKVQHLTLITQHWTTSTEWRTTLALNACNAWHEHIRMACSSDVHNNRDMDISTSGHLVTCGCHEFIYTPSGYISRWCIYTIWRLWYIIFFTKPETVSFIR